MKERTKLSIKVLIYLVTNVWQYEYFLNKQVMIEVMMNKEKESVPDQ